MGPLHGPGNDIHPFKLIQAQAKATKSTWSTSCGGGSGGVRFLGIKKRSSEGEDMNAFVDNAVKEVLRANKRTKYTAVQDSGWE